MRILFLALSFYVNYVIVSSFWDIVVSTLHLNPLWSQKLLSLLHIPYTYQNTVILFTCLSLILPCIFIRSSLMQRFMCWINGGRKPVPEEMSKLSTALSAVCTKANCNLQDFNCYVKDDKSLNAFALGSNNITVHKPCLNEAYISTTELEGILAHEMGHIKHGDTKIGLLCYAMSVISTIVLRFYNLLAMFFGLFVKIPLLGFIALIFNWFFALLSTCLSVLLNLPLFLISTFTGRRQEYAADAYACEIGFGKALFDGLQRISQSDEKESFFQHLLNDHPDTGDRLLRIESYLVDNKQMSLEDANYYTGKPITFFDKNKHVIIGIVLLAILALGTNYMLGGTHTAKIPQHTTTPITTKIPATTKPSTTAPKAVVKQKPKVEFGQDFVESGIIKGTDVRIRADRSTNSEILGYFEQGETVTILQISTDWYRVKRQNGQVGWVSATFCSLQY